MSLFGTESFDVARYKLLLVKEDLGDNYIDTSKMTKPNDCVKIAEYLFQLSSQPEEVVVCIASDAGRGVAAAFEISRGSVDYAVISPREIFKRCFLANAKFFVVLHNHPSGTMRFSSEDKKLYEKLKTCGEILQIELMDFIVVGNRIEDYLSIREL